MTEKQLLDLKNRIEESKNSVAQLQGKANHFFQELKKNWGVNTMEQAKKKAAVMKKEIDKMEEEVNELMNKLEQKLEELNQ